MDYRFYRDTFLNYRLSIKILSLVVIIFVAMVAWLTWFNTKQASRVQYVLVPTSLRQPVYVGSDRVDAWYLRMMAVYVADLTMNFTPSNVNEHIALFMKLVDSKNYTEIMHKFRKLKDVVKENRIIQMFSISDIELSARPLGEKDGFKFYDIKGAISARGPCYRNIQAVNQTLIGTCSLQIEYMVEYGTFKVVSIETRSDFK